MAQRSTKTLIIGGGPAGYTAAIYAARANLKPVLITGIQPGGQLTITTDVENFPGFARGIQGPELMEAMRSQAEHVGADIVYDTVVSVDLAGDRKTATCDSGDVYVARTIIVATGAQARWLGAPGEGMFAGYGVSACATCDGFFFKGKRVVVVGAGNSAVEEALYLSGIATHVTLIHRRDKLRAEPILQDRLLAKPNVSFVWNTVVEEILGTTDPVRSVTAVRLRDLGDGSTTALGTDGVFVAIGHDPATALFKGQRAMAAANFIRVAPWSTKTSVPGVYGAGDAAESVFRQACVAAAMGCMAALEAEKHLAETPEPGVEDNDEKHRDTVIGAY